MQSIIQLGKTAQEHCLEVPHNKYLNKRWSEVREYMSKLLLKEVIAYSKKDKWVNH